MIYAPVAVWTLNRYEHLRCCIDSLKKNKYAIDTEVYISLDFPPSEGYKEGYDKVRAYLHQNISGFKKIIIFEQKKNLGSIGNFMFILNKVYEVHDRIILIEDDNEVSPYFLEYMNYLLSKYEKDKNVFAINGYSYPIEWLNDGKDLVKINNMFSAWGSALWRSKYDELLNAINLKNIDNTMHSFKKVYGVFKNNPACFSNLICSYLGGKGIMCDDYGNFLPVDATIVFYIIVYRKSVIMPKVSQVVNHGLDGSGVHCSKEEKYENEDITSAWNKTMRINMEGDLYVQKINHRKLTRIVPSSFRDVCSNWLQYLLYRCHLKKRTRNEGKS